MIIYFLFKANLISYYVLVKPRLSNNNGSESIWNNGSESVVDSKYFRFYIFVTILFIFSKFLIELNLANNKSCSDIK